MGSMAETLAAYDPGAEYDEIFAGRGTPRDHCRDLVAAFQALSWDDVAARQRRAEIALTNAGITFTVYAEGEGTERIFPFDLFPRLLSAADWDRVDRGIRQRVLALNAFLQDVYNDGKIVEAGLIPAERIYGSPNYRPEIRQFTPPGGVWIHISGIDIVRDRDGTLCVLEDNVRTPSGVSYVLENRLISTRAMPRIFAATGVRPLEDYPDRLRRTLQGLGRGGAAVLLTPGPFNAAFFEHAFLAKQMGIQLVEGRDLDLADGCIVMATTAGVQPVDVIYRRVDDDYVDPLAFRPDSTLGVAGLLGVHRAGALALVNGVGTGVADDKAVYPYVPAMIRFYLGEDPILPNVPTFHADVEKDREYILAHIGDLVVKPTTASGGYGVVVGPTSDEQTLAATAAAIRAQPVGLIAQPLVRISTCPTIIGRSYQPRRVDLRPFAVFDGRDVSVLSGGLTRVALREGSFVVNSSQGGGSKDTWVHHGAA